MSQDPVGPGTDIDMVMTINPLSFAKSPWIRPHPGFPILGVFRLTGQPKRDGSIIVRYCKARQTPVYPIRDAIRCLWPHELHPSSLASRTEALARADPRGTRTTKAPIGGVGWTRTL